MKHLANRTKRVDEKPLALGFYTHTKTGRVFNVRDLAINHDTLETMVIYEDQEFNIWVRPLKSFMSTVNLDGNTVPKFVKNGSSS